MKRTFVIGGLTLLLAVPVLAEINDDLHSAAPQKWLVSEDTLGAKVTEVQNSLTDRVSAVENTLTERLVRMEATLTGRVARMERTLNERMAALKREVGDLRASVEAKERHARMEQGEKNGSKLSPQAARTGQENVNGLAARVAEIEKSLAETVAKVKEIRARLQELRARAESKDLRTASVQGKESVR